MQINCKTLQRHIQKRMKPHKHMLPMRLHQTLDDLNLFLKQRQTIDLYDLLIEFNLSIDEQPAKEMIALMSVLDAEALNNLEEYDIINAASFIRDTMDYNIVRWLLEDTKAEKKKHKEGHTTDKPNWRDEYHASFHYNLIVSLRETLAYKNCIC